MENVQTIPATKQLVNIEMVTDYICPWCYIGKQRLDKALELLKDEYDFEINFILFEVNPTMAEAGQNRKEYRSKKFGSWEKSQAMDKEVTSTGKSEGLIFDYDKVLITPNTFKAHLLTRYAQSVNKHQPVSKALFKAYFTDGRNIGSEDVLLDIAKQEGLNVEETKNVLQSSTSIAALKDIERMYASRGVNSVPLFIIGNNALPGAQRENVLIQFIKANSK